MAENREFASMPQPPQGEAWVPYSLVNNNLVPNPNVKVGIVDIIQHSKELNENGVAYVDMNNAGD